MAEEAPIRVLLVDDDEDEYIVTRDLFREIGRGYELSWACSYEDALAEISRQKWDAFLFDYHLGARTGVELLRETKSRGCRVPILILTGAGDRQVDLEAMQAGAADYLDKGQLTAALLERSIRYAIERRRSEERQRDSDHQVAALEVIEAQLQEAVRTRDEFLSVASHELKTPLTSLTLQIDQLRRLAAGGRAISSSAALLEAAKRQTVRLNDLVEQLLDVSRIATQRLAVHVDEVDLAEITRDICDRFRPQAEAARSRLHVEAQAPVRGRWDRFRIEQVLGNLLSNAIKYGRGKPISVGVTTADDMARVAVHDEGIGIAHGDVSRIFGRFERAVSSRHYGGLGLGLYIAHEVVEAHGGCILVQSEPGQGSTFTVLLPLHGPHIDVEADASVQAS
jgi:signal transduction histidine kinase